MTTDFGLEVSLAETHTEAIERVVEALQTEGFGVLTRVDLHDAFQEKLGVEFRRYTILGACNPKLAHRALSNTPELGLLLPCNVTVEAAASGSGSTVRIIDPLQMMQGEGLDENAVLQEVANEATERLRRVADSISS